VQRPLAATDALYRRVEYLTVGDAARGQVYHPSVRESPRLARVAFRGVLVGCEEYDGVLPGLPGGEVGPDAARGLY
jgi:hypothetical protein